jgi:glycosyltransferase involved in cell wall biosynthesis
MPAVGATAAAAAAAARSRMEAPAPVEVRAEKEGHWPKITLVTAVYNGAKYIEETIRSVLDQGYPNLEYVVVDGGSSDGTVEIVRRYEKYLTRWSSEPDKGVYDGLNKGFAGSTGEIMGWLNASDQLHNHGLFVVGSVFRTLGEVEWITGRPTRFNPQGMTVDVREVPRWSRYRFLAGANQFIQQESTYWRRSLWGRAGGALDASYRDVGDFELWVRFFRHAPLYSVNALIGGYRSHEDAISSMDMGRYIQRCEEIVAREVKSLPRNTGLRLFRGISRVVKPIPKVRGLWYKMAVRGLYQVPGSDWPPVIEDQENKWGIRR